LQLLFRKILGKPSPVAMIRMWFGNSGRETLMSDSLLS
jgi:hypothetical protein